ncbi:MAG: hypothetical protein GY849_14410, partial [Deltaproteobacteria bacterium]|nr:hypothetical protein [Deltaproteobacteria bacterium]
RVDANNIVVTLTATADITNAGVIRLRDTTSDSEFATLQLTGGGVLTNQATGLIDTEGSSTDRQVVDGIIVNQGEIVASVLALAAGNTTLSFTSTSGTLTSAARLTARGGPLTVGTGTVFGGTGTLGLLGTMDVATDVILAAGPAYALDGALTINGPGTLRTVGTVTVNADVINAPLSVEGIVNVTGSSTFNGVTTVVDTGLLRVDANNIVVTLTATADITNAGVIRLRDTTSDSEFATLQLTGGGVLT